MLSALPLSSELDPARLLQNAIEDLAMSLYELAFSAVNALINRFVTCMCYILLYHRLYQTVIFCYIRCYMELLYLVISNVIWNSYILLYQMLYGTVTSCYIKCYKQLLYLVISDVISNCYILLYQRLYQTVVCISGVTSRLSMILAAADKL